MDAPTTSQNSLPGVPEGSPANGTPESKHVAVSPSGQVSNPAPAQKPFGGNVGRKTRSDGLTPGSPEAIEADRKRERDRKARQRAKKRAEQPAPALPSRDPGTVDSSQAPPEMAVDPLGGSAGPEMGLPVDVWTPEDFKHAAPEIIELAEKWRITSRTNQAKEHGVFTPRVCEAYGKQAAFPASAKGSLSRSSLKPLADMFNLLKVPASLKPVIVSVPALVIIIVNDLALGHTIDRDAEAERQAVKAEEVKGQPQS